MCLAGAFWVQLPLQFAPIFLENLHMFLHSRRVCLGLDIFVRLFAFET